MTHFCNAQRPDFMSGIPEIAQKLNASLIKQSKNKSNSWPQKNKWQQNVAFGWLKT